MEIKFDEYYRLDENLLNLFKDIGGSARNFTRRVMNLFKSKNRVQQLIIILRELKEDYNHFYKFIMNLLHEAIYTRYRKFLRDENYRNEKIAIVLMLLSMTSAPITTHFLYKSLPPDKLNEILTKYHNEIVENYEFIKDEVEKYKQKEEDKKLPKLNMNDMGF